MIAGQTFKANNRNFQVVMPSSALFKSKMIHNVIKEGGVFVVDTDTNELTIYRPTKEELSPEAPRQSFTVVMDGVATQLPPVYQQAVNSVTILFIREKPKQVRLLRSFDNRVTTYYDWEKTHHAYEQLLFNLEHLYNAFGVGPK
jgi:hypothetical protein